MILAVRQGIERSIDAADRRAVSPDRADYLQCRYALDGSAVVDDWPAFQFDGPGIWAWSLGPSRAPRGGAGGAPPGSPRSGATSRPWRTPCSDAWEEFPGHVHTGTQAAILAGLEPRRRLRVSRQSSPEVAAAREALREDLLDGRPAAWTKWTGTPGRRRQPALDRCPVRARGPRTPALRRDDGAHRAGARVGRRRRVSIPR